MLLVHPGWAGVAVAVLAVLLVADTSHASTCGAQLVTTDSCFDSSLFQAKHARKRSGNGTTVNEQPPSPVLSSTVFTTAATASADSLHGAHTWGIDRRSYPQLASILEDLGPAIQGRDADKDYDEDGNDTDADRSGWRRSWQTRTPTRTNTTNHVSMSAARLDDDDTMDGVNGASASLNEVGYAAVAKLCDHSHMSHFIYRVLHKLNYRVCDKGSFHGLVHWYVGCDEKHTQNIWKLVSEIKAIAKDECPWIGELGKRCSVMSAQCEEQIRKVHRRRRCGPNATKRNPVVKEDPDVCSEPLTDWVIAIDASASVGPSGWDAEVEFAARAIEAILGGGNPMGHRVSVYYFNHDTFCVGQTCDVNSPGRFLHNRHKLAAATRALKGHYFKYRGDSASLLQVYETALLTFRGGRPGAADHLILLTDSMTDRGVGCSHLEPASTTSLIGKCDPDRPSSSHPCHSARHGHSCNSQCICGLYTAALYKSTGATLTVVGAHRHLVEGVEAKEFHKQMKSMASPSQYIQADTFADLAGLIEDLLPTIGCRSRWSA